MFKYFLAVLVVIIFSSSAFAENKSLEVFSLVDRVGEANTSLLVGASEEQISKYFPNEKMPQQILAFLVKFNGENILFDTGLGKSNGGNSIDELKKLGINPEDIKIILLTHLHGDHYGGLVNSEGKAQFPNAEVYVSRIEKNYWLNEKNDESVKNALALYEGKLKTFEFNDEVLKGIKAIDTSGHTPGHTAFHVKAGNQELLVIGDALHFADIQIPNPEISVRYDVDPIKAAEARKFILNMAAENKIPVAGMHMTLPGLWNIQKSGSGFEMKK